MAFSPAHSTLPFWSFMNIKEAISNKREKKKTEESQALSVTPQLRGDEGEIVTLTKVRTRVHTINTLLQPWATRKYRALNFSLANNRSLTT